MGATASMLVFLGDHRLVNGYLVLKDEPRVEWDDRAVAGMELVQRVDVKSTVFLFCPV